MTAGPALRVSLDVSAVPARPVGAGQYVLELARALGCLPAVDPVLVARRADTDRWRPLVGPGRVVAGPPGPRPLRLAWEQWSLPGRVDSLGVAVHHGPHYTLPERAAVPLVATVHDLSFFEEPAWHERTKVVLFRRAIRVAARRAAVVVCPSRVTADQLARWCRVTAEVVVAPHGVDRARFRPDGPGADADAAAVARLDPRLGRGRPTLVFVGTQEPRKDLPTLIRAFDRMAGRHPDALLVLAGGRGWGAAAVDDAVARSGVADRVVRPGYVDDATVPALLRTATVAVYPALYEGFGLPALEALACGTPLVTTAGTAMAEVADGAAVLVPPGDAAALADALDAALTGGPDDARRRAGLAVADRSTWAASADVHVAAYRTAVERGR